MRHLNELVKTCRSGLLLVVASCAGSPEPNTALLAELQTRSLVSSSAPIVAAPRDAGARRPIPLGSVRARRIDAAYSVLEDAVNDWGLAAHGQNCLVLFNETDEWLVGCPAQAGSTGSVPTGERARNGAVLWNSPSLRITGQLLPYASIKLSMVGTVGTYRRDSDGHELPVLIVQDWDALRANHPAFASSPIEEWLGVFVHEAFHSRQLWHPRLRPLASSLRPDALAAFYSSNRAFAAAVERERALLASAVSAAALDATHARAALAKWQSLRKARHDAFAAEQNRAVPGGNAFQMEDQELFVEGTARYVEARFLIAPHDNLDAILAGEPTFRHFAASRGRRPSELAGLSEGGPKYFYALGMYLSFLLDVAEPRWKEHVLESDGLIVEAVRRATAPRTATPSSPAQ